MTDVDGSELADVAPRARTRSWFGWVLVAALGLSMLPAGAVSASVVFVVTSAADPGNGVCDADCTLREAITAANATPALDTIRFDLPTPATIPVSNALPIVSQPTVIDATTLPGYAGMPLVTLQGAPATGTHLLAAGLRLDGVGSRVEGLAVSRFSDGIVLVGGGGSVVTGNHIGVDAAGTSVDGNSQTGVLISSSNNNTVHGNVIGGNFSGVGLQVGATGNVIAGNAIGTDPSGVRDFGHGGSGVYVWSDGNTIGGTDSNQGNLIANSGKRTDGLTAPGVAIGAQGVRVLGNRIWASSGAGIQLEVGANGGQQRPTLTSVISDGATTTVTGITSGSGQHRVELFTNVACDTPGGAGEGQHYVGAATVTAGSSFQVTVPAAVADGAVVTATTTAVTSGNTSAFSLCAIAEATQPLLRVNSATDTADAEGCNAVHCSLREAIVEANARPGVDEITFELPGSAPYQITLTGPLPAVTAPAVIDATTQPGYDDAPLIVVNGAALTGSQAAFTVTGGDTTIRGVVVNGIGSGRSAIALQGAGGNTVADSYLGVDTAGTHAVPTVNPGLGIRISSTSGGGHRITGNLISGLNTGIWATTNAHGGHVIQDNRIGTDVTGTSVIANQRGIALEADLGGSTVGGPAAGQGNLIAGNDVGIALQGSSHNVIQNNRIGTDVSGTVDLGNTIAGVTVAPLTIAGVERPAAGNLIGGTQPEAGNLISGNGAPGYVGVGVRLEGAGNRVEGNWIGTDVTGNAPLGNQRGVEVIGIDNVIGGTTEGAGNVISANGENGVQLSFAPTGARIQGNLLGVGADGVTPLGNAATGITANLTTTAASDVIIGGTDPGAGNVIAHNGIGVFVLAGRGVSILGNAIHDHTWPNAFTPALGIDLYPFGVNTNDPGDLDSGPNDGQNTPVLEVTEADGQPVVTARLDSTPEQTFRIEVFANDVCNGGGAGEGERFLDSVEVTTDAHGQAHANVPVTVAGGDVLTATATNAAGSTSEFSTCVLVVDVTAPTVSSVGVPADGTYGTGAHLDFTVNWSENVNVVTTGGTPSIALTVGSATRYASYHSGTGTAATVFRYTVQAGDVDADGIEVGTLGLNGGTIKDVVGNDANRTLNSVGVTTGVEVDTGPANQPPQVTTPRDQVGVEGGSVALQIVASDPDDDPLTYSATGLPTALTIDADTGLISGVLTAGSSGTYPVTVTVTDGRTPIQVNFSWEVTIGDAWGWGRNSEGQLGVGGEFFANPLNRVEVFAAGGFHSLAVRDDGTVWAWGSNGSGQLGDGTTTNRSAPVQVSGLSGVIAVAAGNGHSLAVRDDGTVWAWGFNGYGQLGDGTTTRRSAPVQVSGLSGVIAVAAGAYHSLAVRDDGTMWAWGDNWSGQLGDGTTTRRSAPVQVIGLQAVNQIAAGALHSLAVAAPTTTPLERTIAAAVVAGGSVTTDEGFGATPAQPLTTTVNSPVAGTVTITEGPVTEQTAGLSIVGRQITITAPDATAESPLVITFRIDASQLASQQPDDVTVLRNGTPVPACTHISHAAPDPCVALRQRLSDGDVQIAVRTSKASIWNLAVDAPPDLSPPTFLAPLPDLTVDATSREGATVTWPPPTVIDDTDPAPQVECDPPAGSQFPPGDTTVTCTATDRDGNQAQASFTVTVHPLPDRPPTVEISAGGSCLDTGGTIHLTVADPDTPAAELSLTARSTNTRLIPSSSISFAGSGTNRTITITGAAKQSGSANIAVTVSDGQLIADITIRVIIGTSKSETLTAGTGPHLIHGVGGRNTINGGAADDLLCGGSSADTIHGGNGADTIYGRDGNDTLTGGSGPDVFSGGPGTDRVTDFTPSQGDSKDTTVEYF
jgi:CSLREA domain-containing protein